MKDYLIVQDQYPWGYTNYLNVFNSLNYSYDISSIANAVNNLNFDNYYVIYVASDQTTSFYNYYSANKAKFSNWVESGGRMLFSACTFGWGGSGQLSDILPSGIFPYQSFDTLNYIVDFEHPIVTASESDGIPLVNSNLYGNYASHNYLSPLPEDTNVILKNSLDYATLIEYPYGNGSVVASTLTWEFYVTNGGPFALKAYDDLLIYARRGTLTGGSASYGWGVLL